MFSFEISYWFRALARFCDYCLFFLTLGAITLFLPFFYGPFFYYFLALAVPFLWAPVEAWLISKWATTPGKALFGLSVSDVLARNLSYSDSLKRAFFVFGKIGVVRQKNFSFKRKLFALAASSAFVLAAVYGNVLALWSVGLGKGMPAFGWVQYASTDVGFKVSFPSDPAQESKELIIPDSGRVLNYNEITSDQNEKVSYSLSHMELPRKWRLAGNTTLLKGVLDALVKHEGATLLEKEFKTVGSHRVLDFRMQQGEKEVKGRLILVNGTLYKLTIVYPPALAQEMQENPFLDSFEIL